MTSTEDKVNDSVIAIQISWQLLTGVLVFSMQAGFAMLEAGSVRYKNYQSSLIKNTVIPIICGLAWFMWGYAFSFGGVNSGFIGSRFFAITDKNDFDELSHWFYQYTVMCCTVNIISGPVAERMNLPTFFIFAFFVAAWIYPVIVAWTWGGGWLAAMGYSDFAGSGIVHLTGGISGLVGAIILGPRLGKEKKINQVEEAKNSIDSAIGEAGIENYESVTQLYKSGSWDMEKVDAWSKKYSDQVNTREGGPYSPSLVILGVLFLWVGDLCFNGGANLKIVGKDFSEQAQRAVVNTTIAPCAGGVFAYVLRNYVIPIWAGKQKRIDYSTITNGILAGLVAITASCQRVEPWAAICIGCISVLFYLAGSKFVSFFGIDDPVEAIPIHAFCGLSGPILLAFFAMDQGILYSHPDSGRFLGVELLGCLVFITWSGIFTAIFFGIAKALGVLRLTETEELIGTDLTYFGPIQMEKFHAEFEMKFTTDLRMTERKGSDEIVKDTAQKLTDQRAQEAI